MRSFISTLILSAGLASSVQADGIYKWVDENGVVHFGSQPPKQEQVEVVKAPKSDRFKQWQQEQNSLVAQSKLATAAKAKDGNDTANAPETQPQAGEEQQTEDTNAAVMAARAQRCHSAQVRLQELQSRPRVREVDANGNYRVLPEEERQQRIRQTKDLLQNNC